MRGRDDGPLESGSVIPPSWLHDWRSLHASAAGGFFAVVRALQHRGFWWVSLRHRRQYGAQLVTGRRSNRLRPPDEFFRKWARKQRTPRDMGVLVRGRCLAVLGPGN